MLGVHKTITKLSSKFWMLSLVAIVALAVSVLPDVAFAGTGGAGDTTVGSELFGDIQTLIQGNLGVIAGLLISLFGLWMWLVQQSSWGLLIVIAGAALTAFPGIYGSLSEGFSAAFRDSSGDASTAAKN